MKSISQKATIIRSVVKETLGLNISIGDKLNSCSIAEEAADEIDLVNKKWMPIYVTYKIARDTRASDLTCKKDQVYVNVNRNGRISAFIAEVNELEFLQETLTQTFQSLPGNTVFSGPGQSKTFYWIIGDYSVTLIDYPFFKGIVISEKRTESFSKIDLPD